MRVHWQLALVVMAAGLFQAVNAADSAPAAPAASSDAQNIADVRCVVVGMKMAELADTKVKSSGTLLALYYIARLDGRVPGLDLEGQIMNQIKAMTSADYQSEALRCGAELQAKGQKITAIGEALNKRQQQEDSLSTPTQ